MIQIDNKNKSPKYKQIAECIKRDIMMGEISTSQTLISIRNLAKDLNVSIITVKKAYEYLEVKYIIVAHPKKHYKVSNEAVRIIREDKKKELRIINDYLLECLNIYNIDYNEIS